MLSGTCRVAPSAVLQNRVTPTATPGVLLAWGGTLHKVGESGTGIVVRGARILATLAPFADEIAVYPGLPIPGDADQTPWPSPSRSTPPA
jgi:hypothetical protein